MKPSYQSCKDCLRLPQGRRCDRPAGGRSHRLNPSRHCTVPTICIDPPGTNFATPILQSLQAPAVIPPNFAQPCSPLYRCTTCAPSVPPVSLTSRQKPASPMSCEGAPLDVDDPQGDDMGGQESPEAIGAATAVELQMQMPGLGMEFGLELMRQRAEQLEKLPSSGEEGQLPVGPLP